MVAGRSEAFEPLRTPGRGDIGMPQTNPISPVDEDLTLAERIARSEDGAHQEGGSVGAYPAGARAKGRDPGEA